MSAFLLSLAGPLVPFLAGLITTRLFDYADDVKKITANLPDPVKQAIVAGLAVVIPIANAKFGLALPVDPANLLSQPTVQGVVAALLAFILKGHKQQQANATPAAS